MINMYLSLAHSGLSFENFILQGMELLQISFFLLAFANDVNVMFSTTL